MSDQLSHPFLSEEEILFHRMETFHRMRVEEIAAGRSPLGTRNDGILAVHLLPHACFNSRQRFDGAILKEHGARIYAFSDQGGYASRRFNVDGLLITDSHEHPQSYSQIFRDGRLEGVLADIVFESNGQQGVTQERYLRDTSCEQAVFQLVPRYLDFCKEIGISSPVSLFSAVIGCSGVRYLHPMRHRSEGFAIDRSPAFLPDIEVGLQAAEPEKWLRPWCDTLAQTMGLEVSPNYDDSGSWRAAPRTR